MAEERSMMRIRWRIMPRWTGVVSLSNLQAYVSAMDLNPAALSFFAGRGVERLTVSFCPPLRAPQLSS